jgi:hypothetical protein
MNPYEWLGLDPKIKNPNFFVLLGINPKLSTKAEFSQLVTRRVQEQLALLQRSDLADHAAIVEKLKQRVQEAGQTLADPLKRDEYIRKLKSAQSLPKSPSDDASRPNTSLPSPSHASPKPAKPAQARTSSSKESTEAMQPAAPQPATTEGDIPMAIPIRTSAQASPSVPIESTSTSATINQPPPRFPTEQRDNDLIPAFKLKTPGRIKGRKTSGVMIIAASCIAISAMVGLAFVAFRLSRSEPLTSNSATATGSMVDQAVKNNLQANDKTGKLDVASASDHPQPQKSEVDPAVSEAVEPEPIPDTRLNLGPTADPIAEDSSTTATAEVNDPLTNSNQPSETPEHDETAHARLSEPKKYWVERSLRRIRSSLEQRDVDTASEISESLISLLENEAALTDVWETTSPSYSELIQSHVAVIKWLEKFWEQFEDSAAQTLGGQEIMIDKKPVIFLEYQDDELLVRGPGYSLRYQRGHIPVDLVFAIAEFGGIPDIPTWRLQQAAFLATQADGPSRYRERIEQLISTSVADGHDDLELRTYLEYVANPQGVSKGLDLPNLELTRKFEQTLSDQFNAEFGAKSWSPAERLDLWLDWNAIAEDNETLTDDEIFQAYLMALDHAVTLAVEAGKAGSLVDAIRELDCLTNSDTDKLLLETFGKLAQQKLEAKQVIELKLAADPLIQKLLHQPKLENLAKRVQQQLQSLERKHNIVGTGQKFGALR